MTVIIVDIYAAPARESRRPAGAGPAATTSPSKDSTRFFVDDCPLLRSGSGSQD